MAKQSNELKNMMASFFQMQNPSGSGSLPNNTVANSRGDLKAITTRSSVSYDRPTIPPTSSLLFRRKWNINRRRKRTRLHFDISFADALLRMPKFASTFKSLLSNKEKLFELANTSLNENCLAVLLKKFPKKHGDSDKFLIPCDVPKLDECLALADLGASINLMPLSVWKKLSLPELTSTRMTLELANRSVSHPKGVTEDVFVKVGKFYFPVDFVVVDYDVDPRVPLILGRPFLRTARALIDVHVNVIDVACEEYAQEVLGFLNSLTSGNPTPSDPIIASSSPSFTPFEEGDFILEEIKTFLCTPDELSNLDDDYYDTEGDILYLEKLLNEDPSLNLPSMKNEDLKQVDVTMMKPSIEEPSKLELKDLPPYLEYAFLEGTDKLPVIISKELKDEEKAALLKMLERLTRNEYYCFQDGFSGYFKIPIDRTTRTDQSHLPSGAVSLPRSAFGLCNAWAVPRCEDTNLVLNWEKCHFKVKEGIVLGHKISKSGIEVDRTKVDVIVNVPSLTSSKALTFNTLKKKLTKSPILVTPDWDLPFEIMCDASDYAVGAVLGQRKTKHFQTIHYASKTMMDAQARYTTREKELLAV
ncbi:reverse transcriptase domain-containing protein, partial [Tanacetum coccineum]